ncbi:MAG: metal-dependent hydrolase [Planctomycetes bacterium]|nr:metal-dependent hydrolase [Planctomycetota bacterium]
MKIVILGTAGYHPNEHRHTSCLVLPELGLAFDAGTSLFRIAPHLRTRTLDILISHAHLDHVVGLTFLLDVLYQKKLDRVRVHAEGAKLEAIAGHLFCEHLFPVGPPFELIPLDTTIETAGGGRVSHFPLQHPGGAVGYRLDLPDRSMAYVSDTTARLDAPYLEKIRGVDLLIHECNFRDGLEEIAEMTGHSCTTPVAQTAKAAEVGRLVLTHFNPLDTTDDPAGLDVARAIFPNTELATDGLEIEF